MPSPTSSYLAARQTRVRQRLDALSLDALVVTCPANIRYLSNHAGSSGVVVLTRAITGGEPATAHNLGRCRRIVDVAEH